MRCVTIASRVAVFAFAAAAAFAGDTVPASPAAIQQELHGFGNLGSVLHVAAHPDDENRTLLAYLSRGRLYRTGYLSVTRGDGGQNEIGPEFGEKLGIARTQELLGGRRFDGATQFFTRAVDFGYSKSVDESLAFWDKPVVLGDVVRVIRQFRPDVIVTRFAPVPQRGNHGHHNASALLALEAFQLAADPNAYPEQIAEGLKPWQAVRIVQGGGAGGGAGTGGLSVQISGTDPVTGDTFQQIAGKSSSQHKTQFGLGAGGGGGGGGRGGGTGSENFTLLAGASATGDLMAEIDTTWNRVSGGAEIGRQVTAIVAQFKTEDPAASLPALLALRKSVAALPSDPVVDGKRAQLDRIVQACLGLTTTTLADAYEVVPGDELKLTFSAGQRSRVPVKLIEVRMGKLASAKPGAAVTPEQPTAGAVTFTVPKNTPVTQPYWLREEPTAGMFRVAETKLIGTAENPPPFVIDYVFEVDGQTLVVADEPLAPDSAGKSPRRLAVISPVALRFGSIVALFTPGAKKEIEVEVTAARTASAGTLRVEAPSGWTITPATRPFKLAQRGEKTRLSFTVTAPAQTATGSFRAVAEVDGTRFSAQRDEVRYDHIAPQVLQPPARMKVAAFDYQIRGRNLGYLPGAGDSVAECLQQLGYAVTLLQGPDLTPENLKKFDAVVVGVRAFNERTDFKDNLPGLFAYVEAGGTVVAQYNRPNGLITQQLGPYALSIAGAAPALRVTDETAAVSLLDAANPAVNAPNKLIDSDWAGWVQERGAYYPSTWDQNAYQSLLAMSDPGEAPLKSSVLIAKHGKGHYVYTGLAFFRQLPAGVPGAYRLFANLVSLGKE
ncbi:MAG TPA: PIG-L family deacetylase [Opitutaceae bacterium]|nr:PIG-L family deacetylase [Opitutaceae bacterium]